MSGHSRWANIKRTKAVVDSKRSKVWTKVLKEVTIAARLGGGDPGGNPRLRRAMDLARSVNIPNDTLTRAVKKGTGELEGAAYEEIVYEGVGTGGALFVIEAMTDNRNRTAPEIRRIFEKAGGSLGVSGSSTWAFSVKGQLRLPTASASEEQLFDVAVGAGAEDVLDEGESWLVTTPREGLDTVRDALEKAKIAGVSGGLAYVPTTPRAVAGDEAAALLRLYDALDDHDDVQNVYADFEPDANALDEPS